MTRPVILCTLPLHSSAISLLEPVAEIRLTRDTSIAAVYEAIGDADLLLVRSQLPPDLFDRPNRLLGVFRNGTGLDLIPVASATAHRIPVANIPGANVRTVAEYCVAGMFGLARKLGAMDHDLRAGGWNAARRHTETSFDLSGKTLGIVGLGATGHALAAMCHHGFGMPILGYQARPKPQPDYITTVPLDDLLARADIVSLNCPLTEETRHLLDARRIGLMKPGAMLVNAARGAIADEAALAQALAERRLGGAVIDVFSQQPLPRDSPFLALDNVLLTPHAAGLTPGSFERMSLGTARQMLQLLAGEKPTHMVNPEIWEQSAARQRRQALPPGKINSD